MPQLMPLFWLLSSFMLMFIVVMIIYLYCCSGFEYMDVYKLMVKGDMVSLEW